MRQPTIETNPWLIREKPHLIALLSLPSMTAPKLREMLALFGSPSGAWDAVTRGAAASPEGSHADWRSLAINTDVRENMRRVRAGGIEIVVHGEEGYPPSLGQIHAPPTVLFVRGRIPRSSETVAIVGARKATPYGREAARWLAEGLARAGLCVVSGAAHGIDAAAHLGAMDAGGETLAVMGCGVDVSYPRSNARLLERVMHSGAILSEYYPGTEPRPFQFPARNRIIAGLSRAVIVVEASKRSGALITAEIALEEGREVMAVPGQVFSPNSVGAHALIRAGAALVSGVDDILVELGLAPRSSDIQNTLDIDSDLSAMEKTLMGALGGGPLDAEGLALASGANVGTTLATLTSLEVKGLVLRAPGGLYQRCGPGAEKDNLARHDTG